MMARIIPRDMLQAVPPQKRFCRKVHGSLSKRAADYAKAGDTARADIMRDLRLRFERSSYASQLD